MKQLITLLLVFIILSNSSCKKSAQMLCGGDDPVKSLPWLKNEIERITSSPYCYTISRSTYNNETVYIIANCTPWFDSAPQLFDCDGNLLNFPGENYGEIKFTGPVELIWTNN